MAEGLPSSWPALEGRGGRLEADPVQADLSLEPGHGRGRRQRPLRSRATTLTPFLRPRSLTTSSLAGTVMLLRGDRQIPARTLGVSSGLLVVPTAASALRTSGDALSMRKR